MRDIGLLHPELQRIIKLFLDDCKKAGLPVLITDTLRTAEEQAEKVRLGYSSLQYPYSMHSWGVAFDFCRNCKGLEYNNADRFFDQVGAIGKKYGLIWGGDWKSPVDRPHLQMSTWGTGTQKLRELYGTPEKFRSVWGGIEVPGVSKGGSVLLETVKKGSRGTAVKILQFLLGLEADGIFGSRTDAAVKHFQEYNKLADDGVVGVKTWSVLLK